ncbi:UNVERIFIED_CONTAM: hypothetical protein GTU68_037283 [Idotea baltica]|nr:hypothetical protein [Idotea baltica]
MPRKPSWKFIAKAAKAISEKHSDVNGICLRGKAGWGENMALVTSMANSFGARWFDLEWQPQLDSENWTKAVTQYVELLNSYGPSDAKDKGFKENLEMFQNGECGIWIDATVAASSITDPDISTVSDSVGFALAPNAGLSKGSNWLWSWALAVSTASENSEAAMLFVEWATSSEYAELVAEKEGWQNVPPGTRKSLYNNRDYLAAAPFSKMVLESIISASPANPTVEDVPYSGIQYVDIPEFPGMATAVGALVSKAIAGDISVEEALENAQWVVGEVIERARFINKHE